MTSQQLPTEAPRYEDAMASGNSRRIPSTTPYLTPYLGLRARLSQIWFNRWTLLLVLVLVRFILATTSLNSDLTSARREALSACTGVESMGSAMASMPHYMSKGVNEIAAKGIESAVHALEATLLLMITGVQEIVVFIINLITSTYVCLITLAVHGAVDVVVNATKKVTEFIDKTMSDLFNEIDGDVRKVQDGINSVTSKLEAIPNFFGANVDIPDVKLPSLEKLKSVKIPSEFMDKVEELNKKIPTFDEVKKAGNDAIRLPFQAVTKLVNQSLTLYSFDRSVFPIPEKEKLTFCSDNPHINDFFNGLEETVGKVKQILVGVIIALAILAMIPMGYREWWNWRSTRSRAYMLTSPEREFDPVDIITIASRPYSSTVGLKMAGKFKSSRHQILVRWAVAYATSTPAMFVLALGVAGLLGVLAQYILLKQVEVAAPALAAQIGNFAGIVVDHLKVASTSWAVKTNQAINSTNTELNNELFGWVKTGTDSLNDTLNVVVDKMYDGVDTVFGETILATPIKDVLDCLITLKIKGVQKALTWAHDHAHITFPTLPGDVFSLGASESIGPDANGASSFLSDTSSEATDMISDVVVKLVIKWAKMLKQEAIISGCIVGIWLLVCLIALIRTAVLFPGRDKLRGEGGGGDPHFSGGDDHEARTNFGERIVTPLPIYPIFSGTGTESKESSPDRYSMDEKEDPNFRMQMGSVSSWKNLVTEHGLQRESVHPRVYHRDEKH